MYLNYAKYLQNLFTIPLCAGLCALIVLIGLIVLMIRFMKINNQKQGQKIGTLLLKSIPFSLGIPMAVVGILLAYAQLQIGYPLLTEKNADTVELVATITDMEADDLSRTTHDADGNSIRAHYVYFDDLRLYCSNVGDFGKGDTVAVQYLPKSGVVLYIGAQDDQQPTPPEQQPPKEPAQQPQKEPVLNPSISMLIFTVLFAATYIVNIVRFIHARNPRKEEKWGRNTIELRYKDGPLFMGIRCALGVFMILSVPNSYLLAALMIVIPIIGSIIQGHKKPLTYDENGIYITAINGKVFFYEWNDVISVSETVYPIYKVRPYPCTKVTYRTSSGRQESMYFSHMHHIGTQQFEIFAQQYINRQDDAVSE